MQFEQFTLGTSDSIDIRLSNGGYTLACSLELLFQRTSRDPTETREHSVVVLQCSCNHVSVARGKLHDFGNEWCGFVNGKFVQKVQGNNDDGGTLTYLKILFSRGRKTAKISPSFCIGP